MILKKPLLIRRLSSLDVGVFPVFLHRIRLEILRVHEEINFFDYTFDVLAFPLNYCRSPLCLSHKIRSQVDHSIFSGDVIAAQAHMIDSTSLKQ